MGNITDQERVIQDLLNVVDDLQSALISATAAYEYRDVKAQAYKVYKESRSFLYEKVSPNE